MLRRFFVFLGGAFGLIFGPAYFAVMLLRNRRGRWTRIADPWRPYYQLRVCFSAKWMPRGAAGITFTKHIFVRKGAASIGLVRHEAVHAEQYRRWGLFGFFWRYGRDIVANGYDGSTIEQEARDRSGVR
jgi:hypothetical protein